MPTRPRKHSRFVLNTVQYLGVFLTSVHGGSPQQNSAARAVAASQRSGASRRFIVGGRESGTALFHAMHAILPPLPVSCSIAKEI